MYDLFNKQLLMHDDEKYPKEKDNRAGKNIKRTVNSNAELKKINNVIAKRSPVVSHTFGRNFDYIVDGLNIEGGFINNFKRISKIIAEPKNNLRRAKILIVARAIMRKQSKRDNISCQSIVSKFHNVSVIYIHTNIIVNNKDVKLIQSCRTDRYCTPQEAASGVSTRGERLCITPVIKLLDIRPQHVLCEIDDLITFYLALKYNAKVISNTEDYSTIIDDKKIRSLELFMNVPITYYRFVHKAKKVSRRNLYINPHKLLKPYLKLLQDKRMTPDRSIIMRGRTVI